VEIEDVALVLPAFRYEAVMEDGTRENEMCPVYVARAGDGELGPDPDEVAASRWEEWPEFSAAVLAGERDVSPWCRQQVVELAAVLGPAWDGTAPVAAADPLLLPPAGRPPSWPGGD
jgi:isopentenyl-diphosphate delta-isomerase